MKCVMLDCDWSHLLDENPTDWETRIAYSDWLEDNGDLPAAWFQRNLVLYRRSPIKPKEEAPRFGLVDGCDFWVWVNEAWLRITPNGLELHPYYEPCVLHINFHPYIIKNQHEFIVNASISRQIAEQTLMNFLIDRPECWQEVVPNYRRDIPEEPDTVITVSS
jgi:uncharacterized protein (TIGR02996 family)